MTQPLSKRLAAEWLGSALLLAAIVGSGIMGERLAGGNVAIALLANTIATGAALVALLLTFGAISGAHFNPLVTLTELTQGALGWRDAGGYLAMQVTGAIAGVALAHGMFGVELFAFSAHTRAGGPQVLSESVASFGLIGVIWMTRQAQPAAVPFAVGAYITAAYWFTASTSFANPAVTLARSLTSTFSGIRPADVPMFVVGQTLGATAAVWCFSWLAPRGQDDRSTTDQSHWHFEQESGSRGSKPATPPRASRSI
jgi:glycerol uptake facilitator-like aquaporin